MPINVTATLRRAMQSLQGERNRIDDLFKRLSESAPTATLAPSYARRPCSSAIGPSGRPPDGLSDLRLLRLDGLPLPLRRPVGPSSSSAAPAEPPGSSDGVKVAIVMIQQIIFTASVILLVIGGPLSPRAEQRGERWTGISTVGTEDCDALTFDVRIMDGRISGGATSKPSGRSEARRAWVVSGTVSPDGSVEMRTQTDDATVRSKLRRQSIQWIGRMVDYTLTLEQTTSIGCVPPHTATLTRTE
jgi:hypothetical protein